MKEPLTCYKGESCHCSAILTHVNFRYYDQITSLEAKIPSNELQIPFRWKNSFVAGSSWLSSSSSSLTIPSLSYERVCILYNIAASMSQVASAQVNEGLNNDSALKLSAKYFSTASGIFQALKHLTPNCSWKQWCDRRFENGQSSSVASSDPGSSSGILLFSKQVMIG